MTNAQRLLVLAAAVVVLVVGFFLLSPGDDDGNDSAPTTTTTATATAPQVTRIQVGAGRPAGGVKTIEATKGDRVRIEVGSSDTTDEVHLHGYDVKRELRAGGRVRFSFTADAEGIFEMELEGSHTQIAKLVVEP